MQEIQKFVSWYFYRVLIAHFHFINNSLAKVEDVIGITTNVRFFFTPIYGDRSWFGRIFSVFIRTCVILVGVLVFMLSSVILFTVPLIWLSSLLLMFRYPAFAAVPIVGFMYFAVSARKKPFKIHPIHAKNYDLRPYCDLESKYILQLAGTSVFYDRLLKTEDVKHFIQRTLLPVNEILPVLQQQPYSMQNMSTALFQLAQEQKIRYIRTNHIFLALLLLNAAFIDTILKKHKMDIHIIQTYISWDEYEFNLVNPPDLWDADYQLLVGGGTNRTWQGTVTPILNQYGYDLNQAVVNEPNKVIRNELIKEIEKSLQKSENSNVLLIGEIGVGKDTLVREIAQWINSGVVRGPLWSKRIIDLDIGRLFAGTTDKGSFEARVESIIDEIERSSNIILYLNDFTAAIETKTKEGINLFSLLQKPITSGRVKIIAAITPKEYKALEQNNPLFLGQFTMIKVPETDPVESASIIHTSALEYEEKYHLFFPYPILDLVVTYAKNYIHEGFFPAKALALVEDVAVSVFNASNKDQWITRYGRRIPVLEPAINALVKAKTNIPVGDIEYNEAQTLLHMEDEFRKYIVDQSDAVHVISEVLRRNRSGLRNTNKPIGSFLFVGPTGVGKTEMAKTLARIYYGNEKQMIRLDMSEYQSQDSIDRLIGNTSQSTSLESLVQIIRKQPYSLILLDELEKAHPRILDLFLQVLDDARLTDAFGTTVEFNETIIIATSNAGTQEITKQFQSITSSEQYQVIQQNLYHILAPYFRTEFLNRFDEIILFKPLTKQSLEKVVQMQLTKIAKQLYETKKVTITFSQETIDTLIKTGYNPELGARPLQRAIQDQLESKIATMILEGKITEGQSIQI